MELTRKACSKYTLCAPSAPTMRALSWAYPQEPEALQVQEMVPKQAQRLLTCSAPRCCLV